MSSNSLICKYINDHPDTWEQDMQDKHIAVKKDSNNLAIFNYSIDADFSDLLVCEARGIIIRLDTLDVVCWPFRKFFNYQEQWADKIDWSTARVQEKIDGSIIKYFWNPITEEWQWATNSVINAKDCLVDSLTGESFYDIILKANNYNNIVSSFKNKEYTYIFELTSPQTQVVIKYKDTVLHVIGQKSNINNKEVNIDNFAVYHRPKTYSLSSLEDCIEAAKQLNTSDAVTNEGFVVVDGNWNRIKIKSPEYLMLHRMVNNHKLTKERIIKIILSGEDIKNMSEIFPSHAVYLKYYDFKWAEFKRNAGKMMSYARILYEEFNYDRKALANVIKNSKYSFAGFMAIDRPDMSIEEMISQLSVSKILGIIEDYKEEQIP